MTFAEILRAVAATAKVQVLHECLLGARAVNRNGTQGARKGHPRYTRVEFATDNMTPDDAMYWAGDLGQPDSRKPQYVGLVVWVPYATYESATAVAAVDPSEDSNTGKPTTRVSKSSNSLGD